MEQRLLQVPRIGGGASQGLGANSFPRLARIPEAGLSGQTEHESDANLGLSGLSGLAGLPKDGEELVHLFGGAAFGRGDGARAQHRRPGDPGHRSELRLRVDRAAARPRAARAGPGHRGLRHRRRDHRLVVARGTRSRHQDRYASLRGQGDFPSRARARAQPAALPRGVRQADRDHGQAQPRRPADVDRRSVDAWQSRERSERRSANA